MNLISNNTPNSGGIQRNTITKLYDRFMNRRVELLNDKDISITSDCAWYYRNCCRKKGMEYLGKPV